MDPTHQQHSSFHRETPMRHSPIPNQRSRAPSNRVLQSQSPELHHRERFGPYGHSSHHPGKNHRHKHHHHHRHAPRERRGSPQQSAVRAPISPSDRDASTNRPHPSTSGTFRDASHKFMRDLSNYSSSFHIRRDQASETKVKSHSGSKNVMATNLDPKKAQSNDDGRSISFVRLNGHSTTSSLSSRTTQDIYAQPLSDSEHRSHGSTQHHSQRGHSSRRSSSSSSQSTAHRSSSSHQAKHHKPTSSRERSSQVDSPQSTVGSQKRHREFEDCDDYVKKLCLLDGKYGKSQTSKSNFQNSVNTSQESLSRHASVRGPSHETTDNHHSTEPICDRPSSFEQSSGCKTSQSSCASPKHCANRPLLFGIKHLFVDSTQPGIVKLLHSKPIEEGLKKREEKKDKTSKLFPVISPEGSHGLIDNSPDTHNNAVSQVKTVSRKSDCTTLKSTSERNSAPLSHRKTEGQKTPHRRRSPTVPNDINDLFTPDPMTVVSAGRTSAKPKINESITSEKSSLSSPVIESNTASSCSKTQITEKSSSDAEDTNSSSSITPLNLLPIVALERLKPQQLSLLFSKDEKLKHKVKCTRSTSDCETEMPKTPSSPHRSRSPLETSKRCREKTSQDYSMDVELDVGLSFALDMDINPSPQSSDDEDTPLLSLQEMMKHVRKPPETQEKQTFSEPNTPVQCSSNLLKSSLPSTAKPVLYKNNLDQMLSEINTNKKAKEVEKQLINACQKDLLKIAEFEEAAEKRENISTEHQIFLQRYSLTTCAIRDVPPGEPVFNKEKFGHIFNQDMLQLRQSMISPEGVAQKTLLWSSPAHLRLHVMIGLFQEAYDSCSPCPSEITRFLFKMMSVHRERLLSEKLFHVLCDIACTAAHERVKGGHLEFNVWVPSVADVSLVLMNMGVAFVTLFPFDELQPPFTEGDLLEDVCIQDDSGTSNKEQRTVPEHNLGNMLKYLSFCLSLCPQVYSDSELLLLLTVVAKVGLDSQLMLKSSVELYPLQYKMVNNIRDWETMLPRLCLPLSGLTDDHHNMCLLIQQLPDNTRGKQLRQHLSLSMISKLLGGKCTYTPTGNEFQLSMLRPYMPLMQPTTILRGMLKSSSRTQDDKDDMDQQAYYLCYSLLTLTNEASNFQFFPAHQKEHLLNLSTDLDIHIKCDIRENEKCLYRSKVKDLVARISTRWQRVLQRIKPLHGKLFDYWQPSSVDTVVKCEEAEVAMDSDPGDRLVIVENKREEEERDVQPEETLGELNQEAEAEDVANSDQVAACDMDIV